jgi:hypothetical protein
VYQYSSQSLQAEISYRQERIRRDFETANSLRLLWFRRRPAKPVTATPCRPAVVARTAM